jgi:hypothetical protein
LLVSYRYLHRFGQVPFILIVHAHAGHTSASVPLAVVGVPPNTSLSKGTKAGSAARDAPHHDRDGRAPLPPRQTSVKPAIKVTSSGNFPQTIYNEPLANKPLQISQSQSK